MGIHEFSGDISEISPVDRDLEGLDLVEMVGLKIVRTAFAHSLCVC